MTLEAYGVRRYEGSDEGHCVIEFFEPQLSRPHTSKASQVIVPPPPEAAYEEPGPPECPCGHSILEHGPGHGLCLFGCAPEKCLPPKEQNP